MACLLALLPAAGHDQMWLLIAASRLLQGAKPYGPEVFESNPPLILWLSVPPAWLAEHLRLAPTAVGKGLVLALEAAIAAASLALFRQVRALERRQPRPTDATILLFVFVVLYAVLPARDFGQKDHLLALFCLPYLLSAAIRATPIATPGRSIPRVAALSIGVAAGVGIALKPHQILLPITVESAVLALSRWQWRRIAQPDTSALALTLAAYPLLVQHFAANYLAQVVPLLRETYSAFGHLGPRALIAEAPQLHILILAVAAALALARRRTSALSKILATAGAASTFAYYAQRTGWYYQQLPALTFFAFTLVSLNFDYRDRTEPTVTHRDRIPSHAPRSTPAWLPRAAAALSALALFLTAHFMDYPFSPARSFPIDSPDPSLFAGLLPGTPVATLTTSPEESIPPVFRYHLVLAQRYPHLWLLPAILRNERPEGEPPVHPLTPAQLASLDALQHRFMAEDLARWRPTLILVERCQDPAVRCQVLEDRHDDLLAFFLRDPAFRAQFAHYRPWRSGLRFDAYVRIN